MNPLAYSAGWWRGLRTGYRKADRSLLRRTFVALCIWVVLVGFGVGFLAAAAEHFYQITTGESVKIKVVKKWDAWWAVHPRTKE